ncbi:hypothetical protein [Ammoniphilus sp. 3BR4]|uniref:hypothetical protein n=1 Tax=Ammoniphilus sp. 3BR4 TaxID=3158265 RepID=UPI00346612B9
MNPDQEEVLTVKKIGLSHRELFMLFVLQALDQRTESGSALFLKMGQELLGRRVSQSHFYATLTSLREQGFIQKVPSTDHRQTLLTITPTGRQKREWYSQSYIESFTIVKHWADLFVFEITRMGSKPSIIHTNSKHQKFFSRLVHVRRLVEWMILKELHHTPRLIPSTIFNESLKKYGWQPAKTYFYEVLWDMEKKIWVEGEWEGERRSHRVYRLLPKGKAVYSKVEEEVLTSVRKVQVFISSVLQLLQV